MKISGGFFWPWGKKLESTGRISARRSSLYWDSRSREVKATVDGMQRCQGHGPRALEEVRLLLCLGLHPATATGPSCRLLDKDLSASR